MANKQIKNGRATITLDQDLQQFYSGLLNTVAPNAKRIMDDAMAQIEKNATEDWPKRQPIIRKDKEGKIVFYRDVSQKSYRAFVRGFRVDPNGQLVSYLKNTAPYSYMIRYGQDSKNASGSDIIAPTGQNVSNETMIKPMKKNANAVVKALADDLAKKL